MKSLKGFSHTFWVANSLELFERLAFYGSKAVLAVFLAEAVGLGSFGIRLMSLYGFAVFFLPIFAGPVVDRYGFKKSLFACFSLYALGYFLVGASGLSIGAAWVESLGKTYYVVGALMVTAIGGSLIKPCIVGTVANTTTDQNKSLGYSIYYVLVNIGGGIGPLLALPIRETFGIAYVLIAASILCVLLALGTLLFFSEPGAGDDQVEKRTMAQVLRDAALVFTNTRFMIFLVIFSGFWTMFWQIFLTLPFYVRDVLHFEKFEILETIDAWALIILTVPLTAAMKKVQPIRAMTSGFALASASWVLIYFSSTWQALVLAMVLFAAGEGIQSPRYYEYVADLAPRERVGTFMGFAFLPVALGYLFGGQLSPYLVDHFVHGPNPKGMGVVLMIVGFGTTALMILYDRLVTKRASD